MRQQLVWLIDGDSVILYFASYPLSGGIWVPGKGVYHRRGLDIYIAE